MYLKVYALWKKGRKAPSADRRRVAFEDDAAYGTAPLVSSSDEPGPASYQRSHMSSTAPRAKGLAGRLWAALWVDEEEKGWAPWALDEEWGP